jgi:hypothetical protein
MDLRLVTLKAVSICCTMFQHWINAEIYPVTQLCVNILPATKITPVTDGIWFGTIKVKLLVRHVTSWLQKVNEGIADT